jgi:hypothetical protein
MTNQFTGLTVQHGRDCIAGFLGNLTELGERLIRRLHNGVREESRRAHGRSKGLGAQDQGRSDGKRNNLHGVEVRSVQVMKWILDNQKSENDIRWMDTKNDTGDGTGSWAYRSSHAPTKHHRPSAIAPSLSTIVTRNVDENFKFACATKHS